MYLSEDDMQTLHVWLAAPLLLLGVIIFFAGWAGVFFGLGNLRDKLDKQDNNTWGDFRWWHPLWWGAYLGCMLSYPMLWALILGTIAGELK